MTCGFVTIRLRGRPEPRHVVTGSRSTSDLRVVKPLPLVWFTSRASRPSWNAGSWRVRVHAPRAEQLS